MMVTTMPSTLWVAQRSGEHGEVCTFFPFVVSFLSHAIGGGTWCGRCVCYLFVVPFLIPGDGEIPGDWEKCQAVRRNELHLRGFQVGF